MRTLLVDPLSTGETPTVTIDETADGVVVAAVGDRRLEFAVADGRSTLELVDGQQRLDVSASPGDAVRSLFLGCPQPDVAVAVLAQLAGRSQSCVGEIADSSEAQLLLATHPALVDLIRRQSGVSIALPSALPEPAATALRLPTLRDAVEWLAGRTVGKVVTRELATVLVTGHRLKVRHLMAPLIGTGLQDSHLAKLVQVQMSCSESAAVSVAAGRRAAGAVAKLGSRRGLELLAAIAARQGAPGLIRRIGTAAAAGLDLSGFGPADLGVRLDLRMAEAQAEPHPTAGRWGILHGARIGEDGTRLRVLSLEVDFRQVAAQMGNCLAVAGPIRTRAGRTLVAVVDSDGIATQALDLSPDGTVLEWKGHRNCLPHPDAASAVRRVLAEFGVSTPELARNAWLADEPF